MAARARLLVLLAWAAAGLSGCSEPPPQPRVVLPPAKYSLGKFLGGGELRGFVVRADGSAIVASLRDPRGWLLTAIPTAGGSEQLLAAGPELAGARLLAASPRGEILIFGRVRPGADDDGALVARLASGRVVEITAPGARDTRFLGWTAGASGILLDSDEGVAGRRVAVEMRLDDLSRVVRWANDLDLRLGPLSTDGRTLAVAATDPSIGPGIGLLDLASGTLRELGVADDARGRLAPQAFSADDRWLLALDLGGRPQRALRVRTDDGRQAPAFMPCDDPEQLRLSPAGRWLVAVCRESGRRELVLVDPVRGERRHPPLPRGFSPREVGFSADDRTLVLEAAGSTRGSDLFLWQPDASIDRQLTYLLDPRLEADDLVAPQGLGLGAAVQSGLSGDRFLPANPTVEGKVTVLLLEDVEARAPLASPAPYHPLVQYLVNQGHPVLRLAWAAAAPPTPVADIASEATETRESIEDPVAAALARLAGSPGQTVLIGAGGRAARLVLALGSRSGAGWAGVAALLPGDSLSRRSDADPIGPPSGKSTPPPPDWIDALPFRSGPGGPLLVVTCDGDPQLSPTDRERLLARLATPASSLSLELLPGDGSCLDQPGPRERGWAAVARFARGATGGPR